MSNEKRVRAISYGASIVFIIIATVMAAFFTKAQAKELPGTSVEALPVACTTAEKAQEIVEDSFDTILLSGKSGLNGYGTVVLYNRSHGAYSIIFMVNPDKICFIDMGYGRSAILKERI